MQQIKRIISAIRCPAIYFGFFASGLFATEVIAQDQIAQFDTDSRINLTADSFEEDQLTNTITAIGNVEAAYDGRVMRADRAVYSRETRRLHAKGNVVVIDVDGSERFADEFEMNADLTEGFAVNFAMRMADGSRAVASSAERQSDGTDVMENIVYTACDICEGETPSWALRSRKAVRNEQTGLITYRHAILEVGGVPVLYSPFLAHPDPSIKRRSGLLFPDLGISSKLGVFYQQPYFHVLSPSSDITVSPLIASGVSPLLETRYRKRFWSGHLDIQTSFTHDYEFDSRGDRVFRDANGRYIEDPDEFTGTKFESEEKFRGHIFAEGLFDINDKWRWGFGVENQTDPLYDRRYDIDGANDLRGLYYSQPQRFLSQIFTQGQGENYFAEAAVLSFQSQAETFDNDTSPLVAPVFYASREFDLGDYGKFTLDGSGAYLGRSNGFASRRTSLSVNWAANKVWGGMVVRPFIDGRADHYGLDEDFSGASDASRLSGSIGTNLSYPLVKHTPKASYTIEPEILIAHSSAGGNGQVIGADGLAIPIEDVVIPNEDSQSSELDWATLLKADGIRGYDLFEGGSKAALSLKAAAQFSNGTRLSARVGRRWRSTADTTLSERSNLDGTTSDWMVNANLDIGTNFSLSTDMRLDEESFEAHRMDVSAAGTLGPVKTRLTYFKSEPEISLTGARTEGMSLSSRIQLSKRFAAKYSTIRDFDTGQNFSRIFGLAYEDDCAIFQIYYKFENYSSTALSDSESFGFSFTLKTLGTLGSTEFD